MGGVVRTDGQDDARVLNPALGQVVRHPRLPDHVRRVVRAGHEVVAGGHLGLKNMRGT